jgi:hypothetical protein
VFAGDEDECGFLGDQWFEFVVFVFDGVPDLFSC